MKVGVLDMKIWKHSCCHVTDWELSCESWFKVLWTHTSIFLTSVLYSFFHLLSDPRAWKALHTSCWVPDDLPPVGNSKVASHSFNVAYSARPTRKCNPQKKWFILVNCAFSVSVASLQPVMTSGRISAQYSASNSLKSFSAAYLSDIVFVNFETILDETMVAPSSSCTVSKSAYFLQAVHCRTRKNINQVHKCQ